ncbi:hypothetical protein ES707_00194 [subsurface metagenome]
MDRSAYNTCMIPFMKGGGPDRKLRFCAGAKLCSGRAKTEEEAKQICLTQPAKAPKVRKTRKGSIDTEALATCVIKSLDGSEITLNNLTSIIADCTGQKVAKPLTRERFIKQCFKENGTPSEMGGYDIKEAQRLRSFCTVKWKERETSS